MAEMLERGLRVHAVRVGDRVVRSMQHRGELLDGVWIALRPAAEAGQHVVVEVASAYDILVPLRVALWARDDQTFVISGDVTGFPASDAGAKEFERIVATRSRLR